MKKELHYNKMQLRSMIIDAPSEVLIAGRGTGKTTGVLARKSAQKYFKTMPRGTGVILNQTFTQAYSRTLPELIRGWQALGYQIDHHFLVGTRPSEKWIKKWKWVGPFAPQLDYKYVVCWYNSAVAKIVSQERPGSSNGINIDWFINDETKLINETKLKTELMPANRGIIPAFKNNPYHHGFTFTTDMPVGTAGRWLFDKKDDMNVTVVNDIWQLQTARYILKYVQFPLAHKPKQREISKQIEVIDAEVNDLRRNLLYYHEASTLENIHALGEDYIMQQLRDTSTFQFDTQILNIRPLKLEDGFYPDLDEEKHGYFAENDSYFDNIEIDFFNVVLDCRKDKDLDPEAPLHMAMDYNRRIHPMVIAQDRGASIDMIKCMDAQYPAMLKEVLKLFIEYYKPHKRKLIYYWYDHTAVGGLNETAICEDVIKYLGDNGWVVMPMYMGQAPKHEAKFRMWGHLLTEDKHYPKTFKVNRENCDKLILSMYQTQAELKKDGFGKNKKPEHDPAFPADEAPHYGDAADQLVYGMLESKLVYGNTARRAVGIVTQ